MEVDKAVNVVDKSVNDNNALKITLRILDIMDGTERYWGRLVGVMRFINLQINSRHSFSSHCEYLSKSGHFIVILQTRASAMNVLKMLDNGVIT